MSIFQRAANAIKRFKCRWFCDFMGILQSQVIWPAIQAIGEAGKNFIIAKISEAANKPGKTGTQKFEYVFNEVRKRFTVDTIKDDALRNLIQNLYSYCKNK